VVLPRNDKLQPDLQGGGGGHNSVVPAKYDNGDGVKEGMPGLSSAALVPRCLKSKNRHLRKT